ncbi:MAG: hypothetical protein P8008_02265, partial [Gammaproteobacteria bacterium]
MEKMITRALLLALLLAALSGCSSAPYRYAPLDSMEVTARAETQRHGAFQVRASVPGEEEAERLFGVALYDRGIQPVWLEITNGAEQRARAILSSIDPRYFSPAEVAYIHRKEFSKEGWEEMEDRMLRLALPRQIGAGETVSGFVFTHLSPGTKAFNLDLYLVSEPPQFEQFTYFLEVPGFRPDHADVDFRSLYDPASIRQVSNDGLRDVLNEIPYLTTTREGDPAGRPVNAFFVANPKALLRALLGAGWLETSYERSPEYLANVEYFFGRPPDAVFRKSRDGTTERA